MAKTKTKHRIQSGEERIEAKGSTSSGVGEALSKNILSLKDQTTDEFWKQMLNVTKDAEKQVFGDAIHHARPRGSEYVMSEGEELNLSSENNTEKLSASVEHREYFREVLSGEKERAEQSNEEIKVTLEKIMTEIRTIAKASDEMKQVAKETLKHELPAKPGKYHLNFFTWLLDVVRNARIRVEAGASWMALFASKKQQTSYGGMRKRHGTMFSLSSERTTATQTG